MILFEKGGDRGMRQNRRIGSVLLCFSFNLLLNLRWSIPAWIALVLHLWLGVSLRWFIGGLAFWILSTLAGMWLVGWAAECGNEKDPPKENKNPYSSKNIGDDHE